MSDINKILTDAGDKLNKAGNLALADLEKRGRELADNVAPVSKDVGNDILDYNAKILEVVARRFANDMKAVDADLAIKNWKTSIRSALKKLKVFSEWETHDQYWGAVHNMLKIASALLGEVKL